MLVANRAMMRAEQPALETSHRPMAKLDMIVLFLLRRTLHLRLVRSITKRVLIISGVPIGFDRRIAVQFGIGDMLDTGFVITRRVHKADAPAFFRLSLIHI